MAASWLPGATFPGENQRLVAASRLWVTVSYFHPYLVSRKIDWDSAFVAAIPKIRNSNTEAEYSAAIGAMLDELHDPCTYVLPSTGTAAGEARVLLNAPSVIDLRHSVYASFDAPEVAATFTGKSIDASSQRSLLRTAFETALLTKQGKHFEAGSGTRSGSVFVMGQDSVLPAIAAAMAAANQAAVLSDSPHFQIAGVETITLDSLGVKVIIRLSEPESEIPFQLVDPGQIDAQAHALLGKSPAHSTSPSTPPEPTGFNDPYPSTEARILAAAKTWGAIHYFFAYKDLVDEDWDEVFATYLPKFIAAKDAIEYNLTLSDLLTHLTDSHTFASSKTLNAYFGESTVGLRVRMLDKHPVVVSVLDPAASEAGVKPGDIIKRVETESIVDRFNSQVQYVPASTAQRSGYDTAQRLLNGPVGSRVTLSLETPAGETKSVTLVRTNAYDSAPQRSTEPVRLLIGNIGYLDLDRLSISEAESAMRQFHDANGLILDLRGKAPGATVIAAHLTRQPDTPAAIVTTPLAVHPDVATAGIATQTASTFVVQTLPSPNLPLFKGRTIALIDERTIGESEHAGLLFEAANKTEFIGTPSAGADTEVASFALPGGITVTYSARDIRHANGGKLQRLGLQPSGSAPDTPKSIRDGKDEALETARTYISR